MEIVRELWILSAATIIIFGAVIKVIKWREKMRIEKICRKIIIIVSITLLLSGYSYAQSTLVLQEKCAEAAKEFFWKSDKSDPFACDITGHKFLGFYNDEEGHGYTYYTPHYNKRLDKCFILITNNYDHRWKKENEYGLVWSRSDRQGVFNVFEEKRLAFIDQAIDVGVRHEGSKVYECYVGSKQCKSLKEFEELIKVYMEE